MGYVERGDLTEQQLDDALDVERMTRRDEPAQRSGLRPRAVRHRGQPRDPPVRVAARPPTDATRSNEALNAIDRAMVGDADVLEVGCGTGVMAEQINALPGVTLSRPTSRALRRAHRGPRRRRPPGRHLLPAVRRRRPSTSSTPAGCSTTCATSTEPSTRSAECSARAAPSSPSPTATTPGRPAGRGRRQAGRHPVHQRERRVHPGAALQRRPPPGPRDARRLQDHATAQAYLDTYDEGLVLPHFEGPRDLRRPRHRLRGALEQPGSRGSRSSGSRLASVT